MRGCRQRVKGYPSIVSVPKGIGTREIHRHQRVIMPPCLTRRKLERLGGSLLFGGLVKTKELDDLAGKTKQNKQKFPLSVEWAQTHLCDSP